MSNFILHNANPKGRKNVGDCVIRAFSFASGKSWEQTLTDLFNISLDIKSVPNDKDTIEKYAKNLGYITKKAEVINGHKPTVESFASSHKQGKYILRVAQHIVTVLDGKYYDTWDCGEKSVYKYWKVD